MQAGRNYMFNIFETAITGALQHMCFSFASRAMVADANQVEDSHEFCETGDDDSARRVLLKIFILHQL